MENRINIGEMDTLVVVQSCTIAQGTRGQNKYTFSDHSRVWAKVERDINESIDNYNLEQGNSLVITMYKIKDMTTRWRVVVDGVGYSITSINPISRFSPLCTVSASAIK